MWNLARFKSYLNQQSEKEGSQRLEWETDFLPQIERIVELTILSVHSKIKQRKGSIGIYGFDIIADKNNKLWLLEVNKCPTMEMTNPVTQELVPQFMMSLVKLLLDNTN